MYLIMKYDDSGEWCETTPITLTENWKEWHKQSKPKYKYEVYEFRNDGFFLVKDSDGSLESGMAIVRYEKRLGNWENETVIMKFPNRTRDKKIPESMKKHAKEAIEVDDEWLRSCGYVLYDCGRYVYLYTEYDDYIIHNPF